MKSLRLAFSVFGLTLFAAVAAFAQPDSLWSRTFGGSNPDICYSVQQTTDGGYILGGWTSSYGAGGYDFWLVKTDASGTEEWSRTFGGSSREYCRSVQQTADGGYILGGYTDTFVTPADFFLVRADANGDSLWSRTFGGSSSDNCYSVQQSADGGYVLGGKTRPFGASDEDFWLVKTNSNGDSMWSSAFGGGAGDEVCYSVQQTTDGGATSSVDGLSHLGQTQFTKQKMLISGW